MIGLFSFVVMLTCYHPVEAECDSDPNITASGKVVENTDSAHHYRYIAVSRDLLEHLPYGTKISVSGCSIEAYNGTWQVEDTMHKRYSMCVDVMVGKDSPLTKEKVTITIEQPWLTRLRHTRSKTQEWLRTLG